MRLRSTALTTASSTPRASRKTVLGAFADFPRALLTPCAVLPLTLALAACERGSEPTIAAPSGSGALGPFTSVAAPAGTPSSEPRIAVGGDGTLVLSWVEPIGDEFDHRLMFARWTGDGWGPATEVTRGGGWFVNASDVPAVQPIGAQLWAAHWRVTAANDFAYDIMVSVSEDAGATWAEPRLLNDDGTATEHGFVSMFAWNGDAGAIWLDGRDTAAEQRVDASGAPLGTALRYARLTADARVAEQGVLDPLVCDCCTTGIATTEDGLALVYRDRTPEEVRDIVVRRERAGAWSEAVQAGPDQWKIEGCPVNGPAIAARGANVAVAWFTAPNDRSRVRFAASIDGAATFLPAVDVDTDSPSGQVGVALVNDRTAFVSWWRPGPDGGSQLAVRSVDFDGMLGPVASIAASTSSRPDDVPQIAQTGEKLLFAWTDTSGEQTVRTAVADIGGF
jgi:hypothetical protein